MGMLWTRALLLVALLQGPALVHAVFLARSEQCAPGEYWCQDRCGSDAYGDTCCPTSNGQHNMCGFGTKCCGDGCCPLDTICASNGACLPMSSSSSSSSSAASLSPPSSSCPVISTVTKQVTVTALIRSTVYTTKSGCSNVGGGGTGNNGGTGVGGGSSGAGGGASSGHGGGTSGNGGGSSGNGGTSGGTGGASTSRGGGSGGSGGASSGQGGASSGQGGASGGSGGASSGQPGGSGGSGGTSNGGGGGGGGPPGVTVTEPDGKTVVFNGSVIIVGTDTISLPRITAPTTITTDGETFTLYPSSLESVRPQTTTEPNGVVVISSGSVIIIGSDTITNPDLTTPTTITTDGVTITFQPETTSDGHHLIPCVVPPIPICIPCILGLCFPPGTGPPGGGGGPVGGGGGNPGSSGCTTSTVTDYVVSCTESGSSTSCTTISTSRQTGCHVTATTSTTTEGPSCPLQTPVDIETELADASPCVADDPLDCSDVACGGFTIPAPESHSGSFCSFAQAGCACLNPVFLKTPTFCPGSIDMQPCSANNCNGTIGLLKDRTAVCQNSYRGCNCTADASTPGYCTNLVQCSFGGCQGVANPSTPGFGICTTGNEKGCSCISNSIGGSGGNGGSSNSPTPTPTLSAGFWLAVVQHPTSTPAINMLPDSANNCDGVDGLNLGTYEMYPYDSSGHEFPDSQWASVLTQPPSTFTLSSQPADVTGLGPYDHFCDITSLKLMFTTVAYGLKFYDNQATPVSGDCTRVANPPQATCEVPTIGIDNILHWSDVYHCEAEGKPNYCNFWINIEGEPGTSG